MPNDLAPHLLTRPQVAYALGTSVSHVDRLIGSGRLPAFKVGRLVRIHPAAIEGFLDSCAIQCGESRSAACRVEPVPERIAAYRGARSENQAPSFRRLLRSQQQPGAPA